MLGPGSDDCRLCLLDSLASRLMIRAQFRKKTNKQKTNRAQQNYAYQSKTTSQTTLSHVPLVTGILLISAEQRIVKQYFLLKAALLCHGETWLRACRQRRQQSSLCLNTTMCARTTILFRPNEDFLTVRLKVL